MIWYKVGAADETPGKSGLAHFLEHLMFKGTAQNPGNRFSQAVAAIGGQENAFTSSDYTGFFQRVPREQLKEMMAFEADRITGLVLTDEVVRPELNVVLEEQNMRVANNPNSRLSEQIDAALYLNHPYGRPVIGWRPEIEKLDARRGAGVLSALLYAEQRHRGGRRRRDRRRGQGGRERDLRQDCAARGNRAAQASAWSRCRRRRGRSPLPIRSVEQPSLSRAYLVPSRTTAKPGASEALEVLAHILGGGENSRLYRSLVVEQGPRA